MRLNSKELVVALVAADLYEKGNPAYRIAKYCLLKKMTLNQVRKLSEKLAHFNYNGDVIEWFHRLSENPDVEDDSILCGGILRAEIDVYESENKTTR